MVDWVEMVLFFILVLAVVYVVRSQGPWPWSGWIELAPVRTSQSRKRRQRRAQEEERLAELLNWWVWLLVAFAFIGIAAIRFS
jgi:hypothetical protein